MQRAVADGRTSLNTNKLELNKAGERSLSAEQQNLVNYATQNLENEEVIKNDRVLYNDNVNSISEKMEILSLDLAEGVTMDFNIPQKSRTGLVSRIDDAKEWNNSDGTLNYEAYVRDAYRSENFDSIIATVYLKGKNDQIENGALESQRLEDPKKIVPSEHDSKYGIVGGHKDNRRRQV